MKKRVGLIAGIGLAAAGAYAFWKYRSLSPEERKELKEKVNATGRKLKERAEKVEDSITEKYEELKGKASKTYDEVKEKAKSEVDKIIS